MVVLVLVVVLLFIVGLSAILEDVLVAYDAVIILCHGTLGSSRTHALTHSLSRVRRACNHEPATNLQCATHSIDPSSFPRCLSHPSIDPSIQMATDYQDESFLDLTNKPHPEGIGVTYTLSPQLEELVLVNNHLTSISNLEPLTRLQVPPPQAPHRALPRVLIL